MIQSLSKYIEKQETTGIYSDHSEPLSLMNAIISLQRLSEKQYPGLHPIISMD